MKGDDRIVYSINVEDIQNVAGDMLYRRLTKKEIDFVERRVGDYIDWVQAIESAINDQEKNELKKRMV